MRLLIVSFFFPPSKNVGGRKWSFFLKEFIQKKIDFRIIVSDYDENINITSPWIGNIKSYTKKITYLKSRIPFHIRNQSPSSILGKIRYRISEFFCIFLIKGNPYDKSILFAFNVKNKVNKFIKEGYTDIIVSGGPYHHIYKIFKLKNKYPKINFYIDLRDPWTESYFLYNKESENYFKDERKKNFDAYCAAKLIFISSEIQKEFILNIWPQFKNKIVLTPHFFDKSLFSDFSNDNPPSSNIFYAGTLYPKIDKEIELLNDFLKISNYKLTVFSNDYISKLNAKFQSVLPPNKIYNFANDFNCSLIIVNNELKDYFGSKFYELVYFGKFILYVGPKGLVSDFININGLGHCLISDNDILEEKEYDLFKKKISCFSPKRNLVCNNSLESVSNLFISYLK